jgi:hypothetical protein
MIRAGDTVLESPAFLFGRSGCGPVLSRRGKLLIPRTSGPWTRTTHPERALDRIARSLAEQQPVKREEGIGSTCRNRACNRVIFLSLNDQYNHQPIVLVNNLQSDQAFYLDAVRGPSALRYSSEASVPRPPCPGSRY